MTFPFRFGPGACCCECVTYLDTFTRPDNPPLLGEQWKFPEGGEEGVTAGIDNIGDDYWLWIAEDEYIYCTVEMPDGHGSFMAGFTIRNPQDGDIFDLIISHDGGETVSLWARFEADSTSGKWIQSLSTGMSDDVGLISGCGTYQENFVASIDAAKVVSCDRTIFRIGGITPEFPMYELWDCIDPPNSSSLIGLRHGGGNSANLIFDNFLISDHYVHNKKCPFYGCVCGMTA